MFLITITKRKVGKNFSGFEVIEKKINPFIITIVVDNFLSKYVSELNDFSIIESPLISTGNFKNTIFSLIKYREDSKAIEISQSTISGRPIFYHINSGKEFFCSTHISMLRKAGVTIEENQEVLPEFFVFRIVVSPNTLYKNIYKIPYGGKLFLKTDNERCEIQSIDSFKLPGEDHSIESIESSSEKVYDYLCKSVDKLSPNKNNVSVLLSGGIDSSILCKICQSNLGIKSSYSSGYPFEDLSLNIEKQYALSAGNALGTDHHYHEFETEDYLKGFIEAISLAELPLHHLQSVCLHLLFKEGIPSHEKIVVQGVGAGGSFGNFRNYLYMKDKTLIKLLSKKPVRSIVEIISRLSGKGEMFVDTLRKSTAHYSLNDPQNPIWSWHDYGSKKWVCDYFNVNEKEIIKNQYQLIAPSNKYSIYNTWSLYSLFGDEDITLSIWNKIGEGDKKILYSPFYDTDVLNYVFSIPWKLKLGRPENILRKKLARQCGIPEFILNRPKTGFGIKRQDWALEDGVFEALMPLTRDIFEEDEMRKMQSTDHKKAMTFWNMLNYAVWKRLCINNEPVEKLVGEINFHKSTDSRILEQDLVHVGVG